MTRSVLGRNLNNISVIGVSRKTRTGNKNLPRKQYNLILKRRNALVYDLGKIWEKKMDIRKEEVEDDRNILGIKRCKRVPKRLVPTSVLFTLNNLECHNATGTPCCSILRILRKY
jgi:hypothetical protein